jgi:oligopeptide transport system permease protein
MFRFALKRLLVAIPTLLIIITIAFFLMRLAPGGPFNLEHGLHPAVLANLNRLYKLDEPLYIQYFDYLKSLLSGNLGPSYVLPDFTVNELFRRGLPVSITIGGSALVLALVIGVTLGVIAALRQNRAADYTVVAFAAAGSTIPTFVVAPLLQLSLGIWLGLLPVGGWNDGNVHNMIMPILVLTFPQVAVIARLTRASMIEALRSHHIRTARALGLPVHIVVIKHALRSAILPIISYLGPAAAALLTGSMVVESIFGIPGIGRYFVESALNRDYTVVMGTVVVVACMVIVFNLIVDLLYSVLDPRVRYN